MHNTPFSITTQVKCPNCGQIGIVADLPDDDGDVTGAHTTGFRQEGGQVTCHLCSHMFSVENPS
jgi:ribosomal protein S27E